MPRPLRTRPSAAGFATLLDKYSALPMGTPKPLPQLDSLTDLLHYIPETGDFIWLNPTSSRVKAGAVAGTVAVNDRGRAKPHPHLLIRIRGVKYLAHRLAWLFGHGVDPGALLVDHINGDSLDNRLSNLRLATTTENMWNVSEALSTSKSGTRGAYQHKQTGNWIAEISINGKRQHLGVFKTQDEASLAYEQAASQRLLLLSQS